MTDGQVENWNIRESQERNIIETGTDIIVVDVFLESAQNTIVAADFGDGQSKRVKLKGIDGDSHKQENV